MLDLLLEGAESAVFKVSNVPEDVLIKLVLCTPCACEVKAFEEHGLW